MSCAAILLASVTGAPATAESEPEDAGLLTGQLAVGIIVGSLGQRVSSVATQAARSAIIASSSGAEIVSVDSASLPGSTVYRFADPVEASSLANVRNALRPSTSIAWVEPDLLLRPAATPPLPNDPEFGDQWHLWTDGSSKDYSTEAPIGWQYSAGNRDVVVAVLDTGWTKHPDLDSNNINGFDFISDRRVANDGDGRDANSTDPGDWISASDEAGYFEGCGRSDSSWHGTHVAGIVAAERNNGRGVSGVAPNVRVLSVRVLGKCGGSTSDIAAAIRWASGESIAGVPDNPNPASVINMSLGGSSSCSATFRNAIAAAQSRGSVVVAAAGNEGSPISSSTPANCPGVVSVVATNPSGTRPEWSNYGTNSIPAVIAAPGESILSTYNSGRQGPGSPTYERASGTSMATPVAASAVALLFSLGIPSADIRAALAKMSKPFPSRGAAEVCTVTQCGPGLLDLSRLELFATSGPTPDPSPDPSPGPDPGPSPGPSPLTVPGIIDDVRVRYSFKGALAAASISWAHTAGAQRSIYYLYRVQRGEQRWTKWQRRTSAALTITKLPRDKMSFLEIRGVNELGRGLIYQVTLYPKR